MRKSEEIQAEIAALKALKPVGKYAKLTAERIQLAIDELEGSSFDQTSEEWNELGDSERDIITTTLAWMTGDSNDKPSEGWGALIKRCRP